MVEKELALVEAVACAVKGKSVHGLTETDLEDAEDYVRAATPAIQQQEREKVLRDLSEWASKRGYRAAQEEIERRAKQHGIEL